MDISLIWTYMKGGWIALWKALWLKGEDETSQQTKWGYWGIVVGMLLIFYFFRRPILRMMNKLFNRGRSYYKSYRSKRRKK